MDSYIIRIYRREGKARRQLVGVVEEVGMKRKRSFHNLDELWTILAGRRTHAYRRRKANASPAPNGGT